ncbi:YcnI family copper-binding membrane protein [Cellulomonas edaphi]|uniref:YcnI family protein n=1 Tax=Cellulomonas edaphi TaxID=3053468 RepID=A0ABT7S4W1_9CELL|nr:YcnI family protein [Cellulomons edaphi]MDM7829999.1 YcnI family protein [Cellulomons edaphi]
MLRSVMPRRPLPTIAATALVGLALAVLPATAASAHVRVVPESTAAGGWTVLTVRVPNEKDAATTTQVVLDLPTDTPLSHVGVRPVPGWTAEVRTATLPQPVEVQGATITEAPRRVVFTATGDAAIGAGEFQEFALQVGPLPAEGTRLLLPAHQTYSDGTVVDWDQPTTDGDEPEHPAPELTVTAADAGSDASSSDRAAVWFGLGGFALGAAALVVALVTGRRRQVQP